MKIQEHFASEKPSMKNWMIFCMICSMNGVDFGLFNTRKVFQPATVADSEEPDFLANRWRAKYEKQKAVVEGLQKEHEAALQKLEMRACGCCFWLLMAVC